MMTRDQIIRDFKKDMGVKDEYKLNDDEKYFVDKILESYELGKNHGVIGDVKTPLPDWYKTLSLLELQMKALQEDIPINLKERRGDTKDLETFDMKLNAMRSKLHITIEELKGIES